MPGAGAAVVTGGVVSRTMVALTGLDTFPASSVAVTLTVLFPSIMPERVVCHVVAVG